MPKTSANCAVIAPWCEQHGSYGLVVAGTRLLCRFMGMTAALGGGDSAAARAAVGSSWVYKLIKAVLTPLCHPTLMWPLMGECSLSWSKTLHDWQPIEQRIAHAVRVPAIICKALLRSLLVCELIRRC